MEAEMNNLAFAVTLLGVVVVSGAARADGRASSSLYEGDYLFQGQRVVADGCSYHLDMQTDGNLVLYAGTGTGSPRMATGTNLWCWSAWPYSGCDVYPAIYATLQGDGNFVVYWPGDSPAWATSTAGGNASNTAQLWMQDDGNLVEYRWEPGRFAQWASNTVSGSLGQSPCPLQTSVTHIEQNTNFAGQDYAAPNTNSAMECGQWCASSAWASAGQQCHAFTWVPPGVQGPTGMCWLKGGIPASSYASGLVSGFIRH
jgi:hypothetical protein